MKLEVKIEGNVFTLRQDIGDSRIGGGRGQIRWGRLGGGSIVPNNYNEHSDDEDGGSYMLVGLDET